MTNITNCCQSKEYTPIPDYDPHELNQFICGKCHKRCDVYRVDDKDTKENKE